MGFVLILLYENIFHSTKGVCTPLSEHWSRRGLDDQIMYERLSGSF